VSADGRDEGDQKRAGFFDDLPTLLFAVGIALLIRTFAFQSFYVPSESMLPSLLVGDHVFVSKLAYGPRIPTTSNRLPGYREARRGDIVVFQLARGGSRIYAPDHRPDLPTEAFIKRLVGLPGETIELRDGVVWIDGEAQLQEELGEVRVAPGGRALDVRMENLGECRHQILDDPHIPPLTLPPVTVPEGRYYMMGDNRDNSYDSRMWGTVQLGDVEGPAGLLYWSWDWTGSWLSLLNPLTWWENLTQKTRWGRLGDFVGCLDSSEESVAGLGG
jgi:signal peptidase I